MDSTSPPKVKKYRVPRSGRCPVAAFVLIAVFSAVGSVLGMAFALWIMNLIGIDYVDVTLFSIWGGALGGTLLGDRLGGYCRNMVLLVVALLPTALVVLVAAIVLVAVFQEGPAAKDWPYAVYEILGILATPFLVLLFFRNRQFCEKCRRLYEGDESLWSSTSHSSDAVVGRLRRYEWPGPSDLLCSDESNGEGKRATVEITANYCPSCHDAVVHAKLKVKEVHGKFIPRVAERLIYSDFWPGEIFRPVKQQLGAQAEIEPRQAAPEPQPSRARSDVRGESAPTPFQFACPHCGARMKAAQEQAGKQGRCVGCGQTLTVPTPSQAPGVTQPTREPVTAGYRPAAEETRTPKWPLVVGCGGIGLVLMVALVLVVAGLWPRGGQPQREDVGRRAPQQKEALLQRAQRLAEQVNAVASGQLEKQTELIGGFLGELTRVWPAEADRAFATDSRARRWPTTGPDSQDWFGYGGAGYWRVFKVAAGKPLLLSTRGDGQVISTIRFTISEQTDGRWAVKQKVDGPTRFSGQRWYFYTPETSRIRVDTQDMHSMFYLRVYQL